MATPSLRQAALDCLANRREDFLESETVRFKPAAKKHLLDEYGITVPYYEILTSLWQRGSEVVFSSSFCRSVDNINVDNRFGKFEGNVVEPIKRAQRMYSQDRDFSGVEI